MKKAHKYLIMVFLLLVAGMIPSSCANVKSDQRESNLIENESIQDDHEVFVSTPELTASVNPDSRYKVPGDIIRETQINGFPRLCLVHIPTGYQHSTPMPLVLNFHGRGSDAFQQEAVSQMNKKGDEEGFIVVNPQAITIPTTWWGVVPSSVGDMDREFVRKIIEEMIQEASIDPQRIYATGLSNGGSMVNGLGCSLSDLVVAIAPVSAGHLYYEECEPQEPVSVLAIHGTEDHIIPYDGDMSFGDDRDTIAVHTWIEAWAKRNGCAERPTMRYPYPTVNTETWNSCNRDVEVTFVTIIGGEHAWPTTRYGTDWGEIQLYIDATDVVWEFFDSHPRKD